MVNLGILEPGRVGAEDVPLDVFSIQIMFKVMGLDDNIQGESVAREEKRNCFAPPATPARCHQQFSVARVSHLGPTPEIRISRSGTGWVRGSAFLTGSQMPRCCF